MYSSEDLERFYFQYQTEAMPKGISIEHFCSCNKVPYKIFCKWYKDTRSKIQDSENKGDLGKFLPKYLMVAGIFSVCDRTASDWQYANS